MDVFAEARVWTLLSTNLVKSIAAQAWLPGRIRSGQHTLDHVALSLVLAGLFRVLVIRAVSRVHLPYLLKAQLFHLAAALLLMAFGATAAGEVGARLLAVSQHELVWRSIV